jgi:dienelactone hydrolase
MYRKHILMHALALLAFGAAACGPSQAASTQTAAAVPSPTPGATEQKVTYQNDDGLKLVGYIYKPQGEGPFPVIVWNHGAGKTPDEGSEFDTIAGAFVPEGYIIFAPVRRGQGESEGESIEDEIAEERSRSGDEAALELFAKLMNTEQLDDQLAGLAYLKSQPFVDQKHIAVMGCEDGAVQALFGAASKADYGSAVAISLASQDWTSNAPLQNELIAAVSRINIPVLLLHPSQDITKDPGITLNNEFQRLNKHAVLKIFSPFGTPQEQTPCFGGPAGVEIWKADALTFIRQLTQ